jgi:Cu2+-exporting ATPase
MHGRLCATRLEDGVSKVVNVAELRVGDAIVVHSSMRVPVDGVVATGRSEADRSFLTGESMPMVVGPGNDVIAGDVNLSGQLSINVAATGEDTTLRRMAAFVEAAEGARIR